MSHDDHAAQQSMAKIVAESTTTHGAWEALLTTSGEHGRTQANQCAEVDALRKTVGRRCDLAELSSEWGPVGTPLNARRDRVTIRDGRREGWVTGRFASQPLNAQVQYRNAPDVSGTPTLTPSAPGSRR